MRASPALLSSLSPLCENRRQDRRALPTPILSRWVPWSVVPVGKSSNASWTRRAALEQRLFGLTMPRRDEVNCPTGAGQALRRSASRVAMCVLRVSLYGERQIGASTHHPLSSRVIRHIAGMSSVPRRWPRARVAIHLVSISRVHRTGRVCREPRLAAARALPGHWREDRSPGRSVSQVARHIHYTRHHTPRHN
jgi:hypothetical protein